MTLGEKITGLRKKRGLSQEELAITLGVSRQAVSKWETEEAKPDTDKIVALAEYFEVTTDWLLRDIEPAGADTDTDAHMSPAQAKAGAPLLLCLTLGASACGLFLLFYGRFVSASTIPSTVGVIVQICAIALAMGFGLYLKKRRRCRAGRGLYPVVLARGNLDGCTASAASGTSCILSVNKPAPGGHPVAPVDQSTAAVLGAWPGAAVYRRTNRTVPGGVPVRHAGAVPLTAQKGLKKRLFLPVIFFNIFLDIPTQLCYNKYRADEFGAIKMRL